MLIQALQLGLLFFLGTGLGLLLLNPAELVLVLPALLLWRCGSGYLAVYRPKSYLGSP